MLRPKPPRVNMASMRKSQVVAHVNIVITWKEQGEEREYQETFTFHQK